MSYDKNQITSVWRGLHLFSRIITRTYKTLSPPHPPPPTIQSCFLIHFSLFPSFSVLSWGVKEVFTIWQSTGIKTNLSNKHTQTNILTGGYILQPSPSSNFFFSKIKKQTYVKIKKCNKTKLNVKLTTKFKRLWSPIA